MMQFIEQNQDNQKKEQWQGQKLVNFRLDNLDIGYYGFPLIVFRWNTYKRNDDYHRHCGFYELVLVFNGSAINDNGDGQNEVIATGNVFLLPPGSIHRYTATNNFSHFNVLFSADLLEQLAFDISEIPGYQMLFGNLEPNQDPMAISQILYIEEKEMLEVVSILEECRYELENRNLGFKAMASASFKRALGTICRHVKPKAAKGTDNFARIIKTVNMLQRRYAEEFTSQTMAKMAGMSESSFRHHFTTIMGVAPIEYLLRVRLIVAGSMLITPESITTIAYKVGFSNSNYFSRQFHKFSGMTPSNFRKQFEAGQISLQKLNSILLSK